MQKLNKLAILLAMAVFLFSGVGVKNVNATLIVQTLTQEFRVGEKMPDYVANTVFEGQRNISNRKEIICFALFELYSDINAGRMYTVVSELLISDVGLLLPPHGLPFVVLVTQFGGGVTKEGTVFLIDDKSKNGKKIPDGIIDRVVVYSEVIRGTDVYFQYHPKRN